MLDIFNIPTQTQDSVKIFYAQSGSNAWQTWTKPRGCKFIWMMCIGSGTGGYGGSNSAGFNGGGGGGSGGVVRALFPANVLPDTLYIQPGLAGIAGAGGGVSGVGNRSFVSVAPTSSLAVNLVCTSGTAAAQFSTGETVATISSAYLLSLGTFVAVAGQNGGSNVTPLNTTITCPGASGGASSAGLESGFSILASPLSPIRNGSSSTSTNGDNGMWFWKPMFGLGGAGGCGSTTGAVGSKGGDALAFGCGGGGGGSSSAGGGSGGKGGDGLVIIATF